MPKKNVQTLMRENFFASEKNQKFVLQSFYFTKKFDNNSGNSYRTFSEEKKKVATNFLQHFKNKFQFKSKKKRSRGLHGMILKISHIRTVLIDMGLFLYLLLFFIFFSRKRKELYEKVSFEMTPKLLSIPIEITDKIKITKDICLVNFNLFYNSGGFLELFFAQQKKFLELIFLLGTNNSHLYCRSNYLSFLTDFYRLILSEKIENVDWFQNSYYRKPLAFFIKRKKQLYLRFCIIFSIDSKLRFIFNKTIQTIKYNNTQHVFFRKKSKIFFISIKKEKKRKKKKDIGENSLFRNFEKNKISREIFLWQLFFSEIKSTYYLKPFSFRREMKTRKKRNNSFLVINNIINLIYLQSDVISNDLESDFVTHLFLNQRGKKKNFEKGRIDNFLLHRNLNRWYVYFLQNYFLTCPVGKTINIRNLMNKKNFLKTIDILIETSTILFNFHVILLGNLYIKFFQKKKKGITFEFLTLQKLNKKINRGSVLHFKKNVTGFRYFYFYVKRERLVTKIKKTLHHSLLVKRDFEPQFM